jgi:transcriptional regulator with GAF, ATPase, and Fis domain
LAVAPAELGPKTRYVSRQIHLDRPKLVVLTGERKGQEIALGVPGSNHTLGSGESCDLLIPGIAPLQAELEVDREGSGVRVRDRSNGNTRLNGLVVHEAVLEPGGTLDVGGVELRLQDAKNTITILPSEKEEFGKARGRSLQMREVFGVLEAISVTSATVLLLGETGTGKDVLANAIHTASPRRDRSMLTLDCGAIAPSLIEAELFGYERGAFTGADDRHVGAFEEANGSTLFLDEIGELPLDVQPKLLRAIDEREIRRVGGGHPIGVDVRILAATKRDLEEEVRRGRFREDLYFRIAVVPVVLPPLRERREDIPLLVETFRRLFKERTGFEGRIDPNETPSLLAHDWPGNVRELKNTVERALWLAQTGDGVARFALVDAESMLRAAESERTEAKPDAFDPAISFSENKESWEREFELRFLGWLLARAGGSISKAARLASMDRKHLRALLRKHNLAPKSAALGDESSNEAMD